jgi:hypothetical protein
MLLRAKISVFARFLAVTLCSNALLFAEKPSKFNGLEK